MKYAQFIKAVIKDIFQTAFACFSISIIILETTGRILGLNIGWFAAGTSMTGVFAFPAFLVGAAAQVFKITKIPVFSRHIAFFILVYANFFFVFLPLSPHAVMPSTTLYLSGIFIVVYLLVFGIYMGIKAAANARRNSKSEYKEVYKSAK